MNISLHKIARTAYGKVLSSGIYRKIAAQKKNRDERRFMRDIDRRIESLCAPYKGCDAQDAAFKTIDMSDASFEGTHFNLDILGSLDSSDDVEWETVFSKLSSILDGGNKGIKISLDRGNSSFDQGIRSKLLDSFALVVLSEGEGVIVKTKNLKVAIFAPKPPSMEKQPVSMYGDDFLKKVAYARSECCDYQMVLLNDDGLCNNDASNKDIDIAEELAAIGVNAAIGAYEGDLNLGGSFRSKFGMPFLAIGNIGMFPGLNPFQKGASVDLRLRLHIGKKRISQERGYIPLWCDCDKSPVSDVVRIDYHDADHRNNKALMSRLEYIEERAGDLRDVRNAMNLQDVCDLIGIRLPSKYTDISKETIRRISAQASSVRTGDIFFFMPPFNDPNDRRPSSVAYRLPAVKRALDQGALFVFSYVSLGDEIPHVVLRDPREAHISLSRHIREMFDLKVIGITGSIGKTSTKDMLSKVLGEGFRARGSLRNFNNQVSIGQHVQQFSGTDEIFVQEIGGEHPGGVSRHARMVSPSIGVITNIKDAHIGNFGSREKILENKLGMLEAIPEGGRMFLNGDDPLLWKAELDVPVTYFAVDNKDADYHADDISEYDGNTYFTLTHGNKKVPVTLNVLGRHNVLNAVCSFAIGESLGMADDSILEGLKKFETSGSRQNLISVAGYDLFVDCFNSLPDSVDTSLSVLDSMQTNGKKIAVIGDITGMGSLSEDVHKKVADIVLKHDMDILVCYGQQSRIVHEAALKGGKNSISILDASELEDRLWEIAQPGDVILFKASSKMNLSDRIDSMFGTLLSHQSFVDHAEIRKVKRGHIEYVRNPKFAVVSKSDNVSRTVKIKDKVLGSPVVAIDEKAFDACSKILGVGIPATVRHIGDKAFYEASGISSISLPQSVRYIGEEAFGECANLREVRLNEGILHISDRAFIGGANLENINLPASISYIGDGAFEGCNKVTATCKKGTFAYDYCKSCGIMVNAPDKETK